MQPSPDFVTEQVANKTAIIVGVFHYERIKKFLESFDTHNPGAEYDLVLVHNCFEKPEVINTYTRSKEEIDKVIEYIDEYAAANNVKVIHRDNVGRDMGALWHGYQSVKGKYKYYFFLNERVRIKSPNWLKSTIDHFENHPKTGCVGIQVCHGHKYPWCLRCFFWAQTNESIKTMNWWEPRNRQDAHIQEMELVYPHIKSLGLDVFQIGDGTNFMNHFLDDGTEDQRFIVNRREFFA